MTKDNKNNDGNTKETPEQHAMTKKMTEEL